MEPLQRYALLGDRPLRPAFEHTCGHEIACTGQWGLEELDLALMTSPDIVVLDAREEPQLALVEARRAADAGKLVAVLGPQEGSLLLAALRAGARDVLEATQPQQLLDFVRVHVDRPRGELFACLGAHGGCGVTTVAASVAHRMAREGKAVVLVDLDEADRSLATALALPDPFTARALIERVERVQPERLRKLLDRHELGFWVLPQHEDVFQEQDVDPDELPALLTALRQGFELVVVDLGNGFSELAQRVAHDGDEIVLIMDQEAPSLRSAALRIRQLGQLGIHDEHIHVVVNRYQRRRAPDRDSIRELLRARHLDTVREDPDVAHEALVKAEPATAVAPGSGISQDLADLEQRLLGREPQRRRRGWWLFGERQ